MIGPASPTQAEAVRQFILGCLNLDDQGGTLTDYSDSNMRWAPSDYPRPEAHYAMLRTVTSVALGGSPEEERETINEGEPEEELRVYRIGRYEWTVSLQIASMLSREAPDLNASASVHLQRVLLRLSDIDRLAPLGRVGVSWLRKGPIVDLSRLARGSQYETRVACDLTFGVGQYIVESIDWIDTFGVSGQVQGTSEPLDIEIEAEG